MYCLILAQIFCALKRANAKTFSHLRFTSPSHHRTLVVPDGSISLLHLVTSLV
jgi:hypothetical protein